MDRLIADLRYAVRLMRKEWSVTLIAVAALALGIGANAAIFSVVDTVLLRPLPYPQPDRIMRLGRQFPQGVGDSISIPKYMAWRRSDAFEAMALHDFAALGVNLGTGSPPQQVNAVHVSAGYFRVFGVAPITGRSFTDAEDLPNGAAVAVVSQGLWQSRLGGGEIVGRPILLNGIPYSVVGILPSGFHPEPSADVWLPLQADPNSTNQGHYLNVTGRLKPGVTIAAAQGQMNLIGEQFRQANPKWMDKDEKVAVRTLREATTGDVRTALLVLFGAVALVLLIACANVANLLLSRASGRQREIAVRAALGAERRRVIRQLLTESVLLAGCGGMLGLAIGAWGVRWLLLLAPGNIPRLTDANGAPIVELSLDWRVTGFALAISVVTGIFFGLVPALHLSKPDLTSALKEASGRSGTGARHNRSRAALVVTEIALALVLLVGAALLIRTFAGLRSVNPGFDPRNVLTLQTSLAGGGYRTTANVDAFTIQVVRRIEQLPGVQAAAAAVVLPVEAGVDLPFAIVGKPPSRGDYHGDEQWRSVSARYFQVFKIPLLRGRTFSDRDTGTSMRVVLINEAMAKKYWQDEDPVGQLIIIGKGLGPQFEDPARQIVGIVGNVRENGLGNEGVGVMYIPQSQVPEGITALANSVIPLSWAIRTANEPLSQRVAIERELQAVDAQLPISRERSMEQVVAGAVSRQNFNMVLLTIFAGVALVLAAIGIYGVMAHSVQQRNQEIGIRMALGASRGRMLGMVLRQGLTMAGLGVGVGLLLAYGMTRILASLLFGVKASDPLTFGVAAVTLTMVALVAAYLPARRATGVDPAAALRYE